MALQRFREVAERFTHIDAELVETAYHAAADTEARATLTVRFYTWWEHPLVVDAIGRRAPWGFADGFRAEQDMRIEARGVRRFERGQSTSAVDVVFAEDHPALWDLENGAEIFCNGVHDPVALVTMLARRQLPFITERVLLQYLSASPHQRAPYSLGVLPRTLFYLVRDELEKQDIPIFAPHEPAPCPPHEVLQLDDSVLIVADEIWVDVPTWEHRPEWFRPPAG